MPFDEVFGRHFRVDRSVDENIISSFELSLSGVESQSIYYIYIYIYIGPIVATSTYCVRHSFERRRSRVYFFTYGRRNGLPSNKNKLTASLLLLAYETLGLYLYHVVELF